MGRVTICVIGLALAGMAVAQTADPRPAFKVATVKLSPDCMNNRGGRGGPSPGRLNIPCNTIRNVIQSAYAKPGERLQAFGGPDWIDSDHYEINAKVEGTPPLVQMYGPMVQVLLEDRLKVKVHREIREMAVYILSVAKGGPKLTPTACTPFDPNNPPEPGKPRLNACGNGNFSGGPQGVVMNETGIGMGMFAIRTLGNRVDRPVVDRTGLAGQFDIHLEYPRAENPDDTIETISMALEQQLGLKLSAEKAFMEVLVIDHVERPSEN